MLKPPGNESLLAVLQSNNELHTDKCKNQHKYEQKLKHLKNNTAGIFHTLNVNITRSNKMLIFCWLIKIE